MRGSDNQDCSYERNISSNSNTASEEEDHVLLSSSPMLALENNEIENNATSITGPGQKGSHQQ